MQRLGCPLPCSPFTPPFPQHLLLLAVETTHTTSGKLSPTGPVLFQPFQRSVRDFGTVTLTIVCSDHSTLTEEPEPFPQSPASTVFPYNGFLFLRGFVFIPPPNTPVPNLLTHRAANTPLASPDGPHQHCPGPWKGSLRSGPQRAALSASLLWQNACTSSSRWFYRLCSPCPTPKSACARCGCLAVTLACPAREGHPELYLIDTLSKRRTKLESIA